MESRCPLTHRQARGGGGQNGWRFGEFALLILLRVVLRPKILGGGARGGERMPCYIYLTSQQES